MAAARQRVTESVEGLVGEVDPRAIKQRAIDDTRSFVKGELHNAKSYFISTTTGPRWDQIAKVGGMVVGTIALVVLARSAVGRGRSRSAR